MPVWSSDVSCAWPSADSYWILGSVLSDVINSFSCDWILRSHYIARVSDTLRGVIIFVAVLMTIGVWAPLRNKPERAATGAVITETYFGVFTYLTLRTELKEPEYQMSWMPNYARLAMTGLVTAGLWAGAIVLTRGPKSSKNGRSANPL